MTLFKGKRTPKNSRLFNLIYQNLVNVQFIFVLWTLTFRSSTHDRPYGGIVLRKACTFIRFTPCLWRYCNLHFSHTFLRKRQMSFGNVRLQETAKTLDSRFILVNCNSRLNYQPLFEKQSALLPQTLFSGRNVEIARVSVGNQLHCNRITLNKLPEIEIYPAH